MALAARHMARNKKKSRRQQLEEAKAYQAGLEEQKLQQWLEKYDRDQDGGLDKDEFAELVKGLDETEDVDQEAIDKLFALPFSSLAIVALTCAGGLLISVCYGQVFRIATATTVVVAATGNKAVAIVMGVVLFHTVLNGVQVGGLFVCIGGALWYAVEKKQKEPNYLARKVVERVCPRGSAARNRKTSGSAEADV